MLLLVAGSVAGSSSRSRRILTCSRRSQPPFAGDAGGLLGSREGREDLIHSQSSFRLPNTISHNVYYVKRQQVLRRLDPPAAGIALASPWFQGQSEH